MKKKLFALVAALFLCVSFLTCAQATHDGAPLPILMYHHINSHPGKSNDYTITPETFEGDLKYLQDHGYETVNAAQLVAWERGEFELPEKPIMITFDDGQGSFIEYAVPLLEKYDMCATFAIVGQYADTYTENGDTNVEYCYSSWPALAEIADSPNVELAVHTYNMHNLDSRKGCRINPGEDVGSYRAAFGADLDKMDERFMEYFGFKPTVFAYPYGFFCDAGRDLLVERGYQVLFTCSENVNYLKGDPDELHALGRFNRPACAGRDSFFKRIGIV